MEPIVREMPALIKHVGRGARLAKPLSVEEARAAMSYIASGAADAYQTGGFLLAMRMKSETAEELAGFVLALREHARLDVTADVDVDLHGDGRAGRPTVALAAACVAAACGVRPLLRGVFSNRFAKNDAGEAFARLRVGPDGPVAVVDLVRYAPRVAELLALRERLGVRTCINSAVKLLDPAGTRRALVGIFHSPYHEPVAGAARLLGVRRAAVVQAAGGLPELAPDRPTKVTLVATEIDGEIGPTAGIRPALDWPAPSPVEDAQELAALVETILRTPREAPPGATRMTIFTAALMLWAAGEGRAPDDEALLVRAQGALLAGGGARALDAARLCYRT